MLAAGLAITAIPAAAYEIGSRIPPYYDLHESITDAASRCGRNKQLPVNCVALLNRVLSTTRQRQRPAGNNDSYAARWSDDPARMLDGFIGSKGRWLIQWEGCKGAVEEGRAIDQSGLLCASHFGRLQFLHAQSRREDRDVNLWGRDAGYATTRRAILAWARFAYRAATERAFRQSDYCTTVRSQDDVLKQALTLSNERLCSDRPAKKGNTRIPAWRVATLFGLECTERKESVCRNTVEAVDDERARFGARGAILHLIQDSFSQSHVARVPDGERITGARGPFHARIVCRAPSRYYDYEEQNDNTILNDLGQKVKDPHAKADVRPIRTQEHPLRGLDPSCLDPNRPVDDVITASAVALYYLDHPNLREFENYLATRVFPPMP